jgi:hypothetical protein
MNQIVTLKPLTPLDSISTDANEQYRDAQKIAMDIWNATFPNVPACYVQKTSFDTYEDWRISDVKACIRGYVNIQTGEIRPYGQSF